MDIQSDSNLLCLFRQKKIKAFSIYKTFLVIFSIAYLLTVITFSFQLGTLESTQNDISNLQIQRITKNISEEFPERQEVVDSSKPIITNDEGRKVEIAPSKVTLRSLGIATALPPTQFDTVRNSTGITIIISYCEENLTWIKKYIDGKKYKINQIFIFSKCGKGIAGIHALVELAPTKIIPVENVGRCDHTYAYWIQQNYKTIQDELDNTSDQDIVLFVKDNDYHKENFYTFQELFTFASMEGFGCAEKPVCDCDHEQCNVQKDIALIYHDPEKLDKFKMNTHNRLERDKKQPFKSKDYKKLKDWREAMKIQMNNSKVVPVCYGGIFAVKKRHILNQPKDVWDRMVQSLSRGNNIIEGHFAERLWAVMLSSNDKEYNQKVSENILPHVKGTFKCWNREGMMMVPRSSGYSASFFSNLKID